ncbi:alpha/beta hydrolase [Peteryoungia ipomoeae]|uniref:Alpha/beta hydrolase n=1 Tax=Peteryoungia ipomoeae TaxID=1210932 RepID=A0A4S8P453_9HYPH|nr:alpha/beta hydrolase [Peteryoungia ipomoeae]THV24813.1 alpha/beta hydrolase [Peteryoungia ipomoeae]
MFNDQNTHLSPSGAVLAYHREKAAIPARASIVVCHGLAEHSRRYQAFAVAMANRGYHVYVHDHRGHGQTTAPGAPLGRFAALPGKAEVIADVLAMRDLAVSEHPGLPVVLFGHSMGGLIALNTAEQHPDSFQALTVWNSNFNPGIAGRFAQLVLKIEQALKGSDVPSFILPMATFAAWGRSISPRRTDFDWISHDPAVVDAYIADPLCGFDASVSLWRTIFQLTFDGASDNALRQLRSSMPIYLVGGGEDPATEKGAAIRWLGERLKAAGLRDVSTTIYPNARHETLNDTDRQKAIEDLAQWLDRHFQPARLAETE